MNKLVYIDNDKVYGATTLKTKEYPEDNNMALHVCSDPQAVMANRQRLAQELQMPLSRWSLPWQKHTANIHRITSNDLSKGSDNNHTCVMNVDAVYTTVPNLLIGVFTADCIGLLLVDETTPCIACIHSGWKGTIQAITAKTVDALFHQGLMHPESTNAYFSPSILFDSLEVGMEVVAQLNKNHIDMKGCVRYMPDQKAYIDNQGININMLKKRGITHIHPTSYDTKTNVHCFSYRKEGKKTGEHFTFGFIK